MDKCIILLGPPGAGKGTQGKRLCDFLGWAHFSTGDLIRKEVADASEFGKAVAVYQQEGKLVPDVLLMGIVANFFSGVLKPGVVSDGFPRNIAQAKALDDILNSLNALSAVVHLKTALPVIMERALARRVCSGCGAIFNLLITPSRVEDTCDFCKGSLVVRQDDTANVIATRYSIYEKEISGLLSYYGTRVMSLDATGHPDTVFMEFKKIAMDL